MPIFVEEKGLRAISIGFLVVVKTVEERTEFVKELKMMLDGYPQ